MADQKTSQLTAATPPLTGAAKIPIALAGANYQVSADDVMSLLGARRMRPAWARKIASDWRINSVSSGACTAASLRAQPYSYVDGLTINAVDYHVQGSITAGSILYIGIYDVDPLTGMPTTLLWESNTGNLTTAGAGTKSIAVSPTITGKRMVWVASYISSGSTTQFGIGAVTGIAHLQLGIPQGAGNAINAPITSLVANNTWSGSMPATLTFATDGTAASVSGTVPLFNLTLAAP